MPYFSYSNNHIKSLIKRICSCKALRQRHYWKNMDSAILKPPSGVRGMVELQREAFNKCIDVPRLSVKDKDMNKVKPLLKKFLLKMNKLQPIMVKEDEPEFREFLLHPLPVQSWSSLPVEDLQKLNITESQFYFKSLELSYDNWRADEIFKSVLPNEGLASFSRIGHIIHLNLRDHLLPFKRLIGEVLHDKLADCRTVVNKSAAIDNTYRNFQFELLFGDPEYQVRTKEHGINFEFDFSRVYWNPRLSTEHARIVELLKPNTDVLYDVFAGVGPFAVPAAKKGCTVLANDLNPDSYHWLQHNVKLNKCLAKVNLFNKDGKEFILTDLKADLLRRWKELPENTTPDSAIHITMNLPALAIEFVNTFLGLFHAERNEIDFKSKSVHLPTIHLYYFTSDGPDSVVTELKNRFSGAPVPAVENIHFVRNVAPNKNMYSVTFRLTEEILTAEPPSLPAEVVLGSNRKRAADVEEDDAVHDLKSKRNS